MTKVWTLIGSLQHHNFILFRHSVVVLLVCLKSLSCCMTQFQQSVSCQTDDLTFGSTLILRYTEDFMINSLIARCPCPVAAKQAEIIIPPLTCLTVDTRCLCDTPFFILTKHYVVHFGKKGISTLVSSVQRTLFQKSGDLFRYNFTNLSCAAMFFLERRDFFLVTLPNKSYVFSLFLLVLS